MVKYLSDWMTQEYDCSKCNWSGTGYNIEFGQWVPNVHLELICPECRGWIDVLEYPTEEENRAYKIEQDRKSRAFWISKLPEIDDDKIVLVWDQDWNEEDRYSTNETIIRYGGQEIWRESCGFEVISRFEVVVKRLRSKYGKRLRDVVTPPWTHLDLYGDKLSACIMERDARWAIWMANPENWLSLKDKYYECTDCSWRLDLSAIGRVPVDEDGDNLTCSDCGDSFGDLQFGELAETDEYKSLVNPCIERMKEIEFEPAGRPAERSRLERPDQLEDVEGKEITFVWDCEDGDDDRKTVIRYGGKIIWSEPCNHDCFARFKSVKDVLKKKYGEQLWDVAPTLRACINLGDLIWRLWRDREAELDLKYQLPFRSLWRKQF